ncbi:MAG: TRAP transporter fused permease subunit [Deltaproteobacteria bacterium]|nr:TRAP transporter fused permease subunit [Deltaproteobacteria bacterium]
MDEERISRFREPKGILRVIGNLTLCGVPLLSILAILNLPAYFSLSFHLHQWVAIIYGLTLSSTFIFVRASRKIRSENVPLYDIIFSAVSLFCFFYLGILYEEIMIEVGLLKTHRILLGVLAITVTLEAIRRVAGYAFLFIIIFFILLALFLSNLPLGLKGVSWKNLSNYLYVDPQGIIGVPVIVSSTVVLVFILFGQMINKIGLGDFFNDVATSLLGKYRGGQAKVAVFASSLFGMISGSAVANVVTTGTFTIPLMKKAGYRPFYAGAVEAVSSTGGQIMPPIMGASAFIMATFLGIPYAKVALAAIVPAILYYFAVFVQVDLEAAKLNLKGMEKGKIPSLLGTLKRSWIISLPFFLLIYLLFVKKLEAEHAGIYTTGFAFVLGYLVLKKLRIRSIFPVLSECGKFFIEIAITCAGAGILIGVLSITGLAFSFSTLLVNLAGGKLIPLLLLTAGGAVILGMGMPATGSYLLMVTLAAPALIQLGIEPILAHFFVFYYAVLSFLTPPVCLAVYAAAAIAEDNMLKTAYQAMKLGIVAYIVPFIFIFKPSLLLVGSFLEILESILFGIIGVTILAIAVEGYLFRELKIWVRTLLFFSGLTVMIPGIIYDILGLSISVPVIVYEFLQRRRVK